MKDNIKSNEEFLFESIDKIDYFKLLSKQYPSIAEAATEIINLEAILNLPKGTEHFLSDIHGEHEQFIHVLKNGSGVVKRKIEEIFGNTLMDNEKKNLATLVYYPEQKLEIVKKDEENICDWYKINLNRLIELCKYSSSKYTRSKVRKSLPKEFRYVIEELLHEHGEEINKKKYYDRIIATIIEIDRADDFIIALSKLIQRLVIDRLHIIGDIYDRGPRPDLIIDTLMNYHSVDIQWGNHDMIWMGAAAGSRICIANVLRIAARYSNLDIIEDIYGINLLPLATFALKYYSKDECTKFFPKIREENNYSSSEINLIAKMHKAISIIQFKLEYEVIKRNPDFNMESRLMLKFIDFEKGTIRIGDKIYELNDSEFPTINKDKFYELNEDEKVLICKLESSFKNSEKLQRHVNFLFEKGSIYLKYNGNLLFHGCIPLNKDKSFKSMKIEGKYYSGRRLLEKFEALVRTGYFSKRNTKEKEFGMDIMWYLWSGPNSSLFGKEAMTTFERYFIDDKLTHKEKKNPYYKFRDDEEMCNNILKEFEVKSNYGRIINGHIPVKNANGENPVKGNGKLIVIDGGFSKEYRHDTGIAGYTLISSSYNLKLVTHEPFTSTEEAIVKGKDILSTITIVDKEKERKRVMDTDIGIELIEQIKDLKMLLEVYRKGLIKQQNGN